MRSARVLQAVVLGEMPDQDAGAERVIRVDTDLPEGEPNAFYMDPVDLTGEPLPLPAAEDEVVFDVPDGPFHKAVRWRGREVRQRGFSFDWLKARR